MSCQCLTQRSVHVKLIMTSQKVQLSKFISYVLRHGLDDYQHSSDGWIKLDDLMKQINLHKRWKNVIVEDIIDIVNSDPKQRFEIRDDYYIRARYGHSTAQSVIITRSTSEPPSQLFHGTALKNVDSILKSGLKKMKRDYVHLTDDVSTAIDVGKRYGRPIIIIIDSKHMHDDGLVFSHPTEHLWIVDLVPPEYIIGIHHPP